MARAYEGDATRQLARAWGYWPVVPPRCHCKVKGDYDGELYRRRKDVERFFGRLKRFRRISPTRASWLRGIRALSGWRASLSC